MTSAASHRRLFGRSRGVALQGSPCPSQLSPSQPARGREISVSEARYPGAGHPPVTGRDVLACVTGRQDRGLHAADPAPALALPRGTTRCLVLTPTRGSRRRSWPTSATSRHTPVGAASRLRRRPGPQEHAFRSGVDVIVATPGRARSPTPTHAARHQVPVLDEAIMLDMGFLPDIRRCSHVPADAVLQRPCRRIGRLASDMLRPGALNLQRRPRPRPAYAGRVPGAQHLKSRCCRHPRAATRVGAGLHAHRTARQGRALPLQQGVRAERKRQPQPEPAHLRAGGLQVRRTACWWPRTSRRAARRGPRRRELRRPGSPRTTSTASAHGPREATGEAFTFMSRGGRGSARDRARGRQAAAARDRAGLRLRGRGRRRNGPGERDERGGGGHGGRAAVGDRTAAALAAATVVAADDAASGGPRRRWRQAAPAQRWTLRAVCEQHELATLWPSASGPQVAAHTQPLGARRRSAMATRASTTCPSTLVLGAGAAGSPRRRGG
jgi:hypothetical protein